MTGLTKEPNISPLKLTKDDDKTWKFHFDLERDNKQFKEHFSRLEGDCFMWLVTNY